jgi:hypothetical protein
MWVLSTSRSLERPLPGKFMTLFTGNMQRQYIDDEEVLLMHVPHLWRSYSYGIT